MAWIARDRTGVYIFSEEPYYDERNDCWESDGEIMQMYDELFKFEIEIFDEPKRI